MLTHDRTCEDCGGTAIERGRICQPCADKLADKLWPRGVDLPRHSGEVPEEHFGSTCNAACAYCGMCS